MIPATITAGARADWSEPAACSASGLTIESPTYVGTYWLRTNTAGEGVEVTGTPANGGGWDFALLPGVSATMDPGQWFWEFQASDGSDGIYSLQTGTVQVLAGLAYTGTPGAVDQRTQAELDLEAVRDQIRAIVAKGTSQYQIANRARTMLGLEQLRKQERALVARVNAEARAKAISDGAPDPALIRGVFRR